ncbi:hypothetical protein Pan216_44160 [Planctomycetes bacterium Pan216]|uniref:VWFA domain-containing protein n=1 Tax=Kolteria novifilia TaxID=2527975 RepID=A0A518B978_9BACT|nr:hypothetical protein Pan216_44160 [Planctomycetes bacterium Pan216]
MSLFPQNLASIACVLFLVTAGRLSADATTAAELRLHREPTGEATFALLLRDPFAASDELGALDLAVLLDLSASRTGAAREETVARVRSLVDGLTGGSRVTLYLTQRPEAPLPKRPAAVGSPALGDALAGLEEVAPLGATNLSAALEAVTRWIGDRDGELPKAIAVVGNPSGTLGELDSQEVTQLCGVLIRARTPLYVVTLAGEPETSMLAALAVATGGNVLPAGESVADGTRTLLRALACAPFYPSELTLAPEVAGVVPQQLPPLRRDRRTLLMGRWKTSDRMSLHLKGFRGSKPLSMALEVTPVEEKDGAHLKDLHYRWLSQSKKPALRDAEVNLAIAKAQTGVRLQTVLAGAKAALATRDLDVAKKLYQQALHFEPDNMEAGAGLRAVQRLEQGKDPRETTPPVDSRTSSDRDLIEEARAKEAIEVQRLNRLVSENISEANRIADEEPNRAIEILKTTLATLDASPIDASRLASLRRRLERKLRTTWRQNQRMQADAVARDRAAAVISRKESRQREELVRQLTTKELMSRYRALFSEAKWDQAVRVADEIVEQNPDEVAAHAAKWRGELAGRYARINEVEVQKQRGYWDALYSVERAAIPMSDASPIHFPPARVWEELSARRKKYESVDLTPVSPAEAKIRRALTQPVSVDFQDTPLRDVIEFLRDLTGANIVIDQNGLDELGLDPDVPTTLHLESVSLKSALRLILRPMELTYLIEDEVLLITSEQVAADELITKVYPVADLVIPIIDFNSGNVGLSGALGGGNAGQGALGSGGGNNAGQGIGNFGAFGVQGINNNRPANNNTGGDISEDLIELIKRVIAPETWDSVGGRGSIRPFRLNVVATATDQVQGQLNAAMRQLRDNGGGAVPEAERQPPARQEEPPRADDWQSHFKSHRESSAAIQWAVHLLTTHGYHDHAARLLEGVLQQGPPATWMYEALGYSLFLAGEDPERVEEALLSLVDLRPDQLPTRLRVASRLAQLGRTVAAKELLRDSMERFPGALAVHELAFELAAHTDDLDLLASSANHVLGNEWPGHRQDVHERMRQRLASYQGQLRRRQERGQAQRLSEIAQRVRERDLEIMLRWAGEADLDLNVVEPTQSLCSPLWPQGEGGGVLAGDHRPNEERYVAVEGFPGDYDVFVRRVWGKPTGGRVTLDVVRHRGTDREVRERHTIAMEDLDKPVTVNLADGRRTEPLRVDPQADHPLVAAEERGDGISPRMRLRQLVEQGAFAQIAPIRPSPPLAQSAFLGGVTSNVSAGAVAFDPVVTVVNDGTTLQVQSAVSADRRFVRMQLSPIIQSIEGFRTTTVSGVAR